MILVIDGYNLLKQIFPGIKESLEKQRLQFIRQLSYYKSKKTDIKDIVVVFDAGPSSHATREVRSGIVVVYSGQKTFRSSPQSQSPITNFINRTSIFLLLHRFSINN